MKKSAPENRRFICVLHAVFKIKTQDIQKHNETGNWGNSKRPQAQSHTLLTMRAEQKLKFERYQDRFLRNDLSLLMRCDARSRWCFDQVSGSSVIWCDISCSDNILVSEEKQRILLLERVRKKAPAWMYKQGEKVWTNQLNLSYFQTLHMKEEENKRLSQRLVSPRSCELCCTCSTRWQ